MPLLYISRGAKRYVVFLTVSQAYRIKMIKSVIFDMDGVIADSHNIINNLFTQLLNKHLNLNLDVKEFAKYPGMRFEHRTEILTKEKGIHLSKEEIDEIMEIGREEYYNNKIDYTRIYPGMKELLEELKKSNIKIALGTNGSRRTIAKLIEQFNIKIKRDRAKIS